MAFVRASQGSGGGMSLKDVYENLVYNSGFSFISDGTAYNSRCSIEKARIVADTDNRTCYVYADFTITYSSGTVEDYFAIIQFANFTASYLPYQRTSNAKIAVNLTTDGDSTTNLGFYIGDAGNANRNFISVAKHTLTTGTHYIVYGSWTY